MKRLIPTAIILEALKIIYFYKVFPFFVSILEKDEALGLVFILPSMFVAIPEMLARGGCSPITNSTWILMFLTGTLVNVIILSAGLTVWNSFKSRRTK